MNISTRPLGTRRTKRAAGSLWPASERGGSVSPPRRRRRSRTRTCWMDRSSGRRSRPVGRAIQFVQQTRCGSGLSSEPVPTPPSRRDAGRARLSFVAMAALSVTRATGVPSTSGGSRVARRSLNAGDPRPGSRACRCARGPQLSPAARGLCFSSVVGHGLSVVTAPS